MHNQQQRFQSQIQGWSECFQSDYLFEQHPKPSSPKLNPQSLPIKSKTQISSYETNLKNLLDTYGESSQLQEFIQPKSYHCIEEQEGEQIQTGKRPARVQKAGQYSKNYRQKKKEHLKMLQQENQFLKKKVDELQMRLREKQMELNRIKFAAKQDEYDIQKINAEMTQKLSLIADDNFDNNFKVNEEKKIEMIEEEKKMPEFLKFFQTYGLGGQKSKQLLQYYMNEFLQNVMRDREKYYLMKGLRKHELVQIKTPLDYALQQLIEQTTEQQAKKCVKFYAQLSPLTFGIKDTCRELYRVYGKLINLLEKIHETLKFEFSQSLQMTKKRLRIILWFQQNQYRKEVRNLRAEWMDMIKSQNSYEEQHIHQEKTKKKKQH